MAGGADPTADAGDDSGQVIVTITKNDDGSYMVYAGDEPDGGSDADTSADDADAMGAAGAAPAGGAGMAGGGSAQGIPADSVGAALKAAMDILQADKSSEGAPGNAEDQFQSGFTSDKNPTPASGPSMR
jgi:hypothetical protein